MEWQPIETAPKDGTWVLAFGRGYEELREHGRWLTHDMAKPRVPMVFLIKWVEGWYDREVEDGGGIYHKERTQGYAHWSPEPHAFRATHWLPLPAPPTEDG